MHHEYHPSAAIGRHRYRRFGLEGVEFKTYATYHLRHARVIAIESEREFGLSVLQKPDDEMTRRGALFRGIASPMSLRPSPSLIRTLAVS